MRRPAWILLPLALTACDDVAEPEDQNEGEVITTVVLTFAPSGGGEALEVRWADPENDGSPVVDPIVLSDAGDYTLGVGFLNELEDPPEDIGAEVAAEGDEHQVFFTGGAVEGPATGENPAAVIGHAYADQDASGYPVGLENTITTLAPGSGTLTVTLRHLPAESDPKSADLAEQAAAGGFDAIVGDSDVSVDFEVTVE